MAVSDPIQTPDIPDRKASTNLRNGSTGAKIVTQIAYCLTLPWLWLILLVCGLFVVTLLATAVREPSALSADDLIGGTLAFLILTVCVRGRKSLTRLLKQPSYARAVPLILVMLVVSGLFVSALPSFMTRRGPSRMASAIGSMESLRAALAAYAGDSAGNSFPAAIADWGALTTLVNANGATLKKTAAEQGLLLRGYTAIDRDRDGVVEDYTMSFLVDGIPDTTIGRLILVSPSGIDQTKP